MAVGGYGRGEMARYSDVDIAFVTPWKPTDWTETGDRGDALSAVGPRPQGRPFEPPRRRDRPRTRRATYDPHRDARRRATCGATRRSTTRSSARFWKEWSPAASAALRQARSSTSATSGTSGWATAATSSSPMSRRARAALRDLHTLYWIGKYVLSAARAPPSWSSVGLFSQAELRRFQRAERFLLGGALPSPPRRRPAPRSG